MSFTPSTLVVIRRYPVAGAYGSSGNDAGVGAEERRLLSNAGIESYVKLDRIGSMVLVVPQEQLAEAKHVLSDIPDLFECHLAPPCPHCHAPHPSPRPPYEIGVVGAGLLAAVGVELAGWYIGIGYALLAVSVVSGAVLYSHLPFWRCHVCGHRYGTGAEDGRRVLSFPRR
ncbi:MAG TPA: hypothetical protein VLV86_16675 [Vicinamibacterales bacterium]|nr:hypothetical protein [Vicinamibacterales bacterium]